ncbi:hypothetical protein BDZ90DRAFT_233028 [Jaminaea rosea]|uniref:Mur ligase n=1 Tax=Jaminaea rosea TaxID=1569628 RepID=A0A316UNT8_9BASI|nr:hypothetical protein BDZ90DRAFT_233028 [Jaminaea rosea]PWN26946.1 hypothetical protein BDZ90DRAFT_233028 [Jaminaea rosea]
MSNSAAAMGTPNPTAIKLGLERILPLLHNLGSPHAHLPVIHIAGTNSKGSTSSLLDSLLTTIGITTARFNSPHLRTSRDSCRIGGEVVSSHVWAAASHRVAEVDSSTGVGATPFELLFAQFLTSCQLNTPRPQLLIVECGLGGLTDATNVFPAQNVLASVMTPIGGDHKALLGPGIGDVAQHKMGIAKQGGLVIVADQRPSGREGREGRGEAEQGQGQQGKQRAYLSRWGAEEEGEQMLGQEGAQVMATIRRVGETLKARLVRCEELPIPTTTTAAAAAFVAQEGEDVQQRHPRNPWEKRIPSHCLLSPILQLPHNEEEHPRSEGQLASTLFTNTPYSSLPGQRPLLTPLLPPLPQTRAVRCALSTALNTLFAIGADEPWSSPSRQEDNSDPHEELRLQLAWGIRESGLLSGERGALSAGWAEGLVRGVEGWEGRGSWVDVPLAEGGGGLHAYVDGAHNLPALQALFEHLSGLIASRARAQRKVNVTLLLSFSSSKATDGDLESILSLLSQAPDLLSRSPRQAAEPAHLSETFERSVSLGASGATRSQSQSQGRGQADMATIRVGFLPFSTPVEGMPWVEPYSATQLAGALRERQGGSGEGISEVQEFARLEKALEWARRSGNGRPAQVEGEEEEKDSLIVVSGSLYLVGELYRLVDAREANDAATDAAADAAVSSTSAVDTVMS